MLEDKNAKPGEPVLHMLLSGMGLAVRDTTFNYDLARGVSETQTESVWADLSV